MRQLCPRCAKGNMVFRGRNTARRCYPRCRARAHLPRLPGCRGVFAPEKLRRTCRRAKIRAGKAAGRRWAYLPPRTRTQPALILAAGRHIALYTPRARSAQNSGTCSNPSARGSAISRGIATASCSLKCSASSYEASRKRAADGRPLLPSRPARFFCSPQFCFRLAADGRPYAKPPYVQIAFRNRRRGAQWAPALPRAFRTVFPQAGNFLRAAGGRPYAKSHICRSLSGTAVGAPIGRPSCPLHSAWPSAGGQFCFRGRPVAAPTRSPIYAARFPEPPLRGEMALPKGQRRKWEKENPS